MCVKAMPFGGESVIVRGVLGKKEKSGILGRVVGSRRT